VSRKTPVVDVPETRYAKSGDLHIAYQVTGSGAFDLVFVPPFASNVELMWQVPSYAALFRGLERLGRLIRLDKRGTGMSDALEGIPSLETRMDDVRAVMDAVGSRRAALLGVAEGGAMSLLFAASHPERVWSLILWATAARTRWAPDYPFGKREEEVQQERADLVRDWTEPQRMLASLDRIAPSLDDGSRSALAWALRHSATPGAAAAVDRVTADIDVRPVLGAIRVPTLVMVRAGDPTRNLAGSRYIAERIPIARFVELAGSDHPIHAGDTDAVLAEIESFLDASWGSAQARETEPHRVLATVLFTDLVGSTEKAMELGPRWRDLLAKHNAVIRRELVRYSGREIDTAGDGFFASGFDGPARAIKCGCAIRDAIAELGLRIRVGVHTGECDVVDGKLSGLAVNIGARVAAQADDGEVLVSGTVKDLVAGSGINFESRGTHELKGLGEWPLYAVTESDEQALTPAVDG
jgi:class 3 adenylate cyclase